MRHLHVTLQRTGVISTTLSYIYLIKVVLFVYPMFSHTNEWPILVEEVHSRLEKIDKHLLKVTFKPHKNLCALLYNGRRIN